jgi:radical SAM protein with 4Fe4S-binding SPASM domain
LWREGLPTKSLNWFDEKLAGLANTPSMPSARCSFGKLEVAVAPSGRLYPCERLIGEDGPDNAHVLDGHVMDGVTALGAETRPFSRDDSCSDCAIEEQCNTFCQCSNTIRTGDGQSPDLLLCTVNQLCLEATARSFVNQDAISV